MTIGKPSVGVALVDDKWKSAAKRAVRTFVQAFLAVYALPELIDWIAGTGTFDVGLARSAAAAGVAAAVAAVWRAFLDPSSVPSLSDTKPADPVP